MSPSHRRFGWSALFPSVVSFFFSDAWIQLVFFLNPTQSFTKLMRSLITCSATHVPLCHFFCPTDTSVTAKSDLSHLLSWFSNKLCDDSFLISGAEPAVSAQGWPKGRCHQLFSTVLAASSSLKNVFIFQNAQKCSLSLVKV